MKMLKLKQKKTLRNNYFNGHPLGCLWRAAVAANWIDQINLTKIVNCNTQTAASQPQRIRIQADSCWLSWAKSFFISKHYQVNNLVAQSM